MLLGWIIVSQFPFPVVHAHGEKDPLAADLISHLGRHHHEVAPPDADEFHLHFAMCWELTSEPDPGSSPEPTPLGFSDHPGTLESVSETETRYEVDARTIDLGIVGSEAVPCPAHSTLPRSTDRASSFLHTFAFVRLHALLGVCLC